jgi:regulator of nucleoside diphosphate kinase
LRQSILIAAVSPGTDHVNRAVMKKRITVNSRVHLRDIITDRQTEITLTRPQDAEPRERKVSILSEVGIALLGKRESDIVSWKTPGKVGQFEIVKVNL